MLFGTAALLRRAALSVTTVRANHLIAQANGVPSPGRRPLGVGRWLDVVCGRPGKPLFGTKAATVPPTLFRRLAAARVILTRKRLGRILLRESRERKSDRGGQVADQSYASNGSVRERPPADIPSRPSHRSPRLLAQGWFNPGKIIRREKVCVENRA